MSANLKNSTTVTYPKMESQCKPMDRKTCYLNFKLEFPAQIEDYP